MGLFVYNGDMKEMLRKKYRISVQFSKRHSVDFDYDQLGMGDVIDFMHSSDQIQWAMDFLSKKATPSAKVKPKHFASLSHKQWQGIGAILLKSFTEAQGNSKRKVREQAPFSSMICLIMEHTNETFESILNLTWDQINFLVDGIRWNIRSQSKKAREENKREMLRKRSQAAMTDQEALEKAKEMEERLRKGEIKFSKTESRKI